MRCVHEASLYKNNCFVTLTYDDANLPYRSQLTYEHFCKFLKRLRERRYREIGYRPNIRFYMAGEYGSQNWRPHYHAILFNHDWNDKLYFKTTGSGEKIYTSSTLEQLWPYGYSSTANATFESAAYIARYCLAKRTGDEAEAWYRRQDENGIYQLIPEFNEMSRKPGIGTDWLRFYKKDVYTHDQIIINGHKSSVPKFYDKLFKKINADKMAEFKEEREWKGYLNAADNTPERLRVKEIVQQAKLKHLQRGQI